MGSARRSGRRTPGAAIAAAALVGAGWMAAPAAAAAVAPGPGDRDGTVRIDGRTRTYRVHVPPQPTGALVLALHGGGSNGPATTRLTGLSALADREGFVVVYPDGVGGNWNDGRARRGNPAAGVDDVAFLRRLVHTVRTEEHLSRGPTFVTGISNGAMMTERLACEAPELVTAAAVVAGPMPEALASHCRSGRPVPMLIMHGTDDPLVPYGGGPLAGIARGRGRVLSVDATARLWARRDHCDTAPQTRAAAAHVAVTSWTDCRGGARVERWTVDGGGHTWPGGPQYLPARVIGPTNREIDATAVIWDFFTRADGEAT